MSRREFSSRMKIRAVVFDLDGTLIDGYEGIHETLSRTLIELGLAPPSYEQTRQRVGHGLESLLEKSVGKTLAPRGVEIYRKFYPEVMIQKSRLLSGVPEVLDELSKKNYLMAVASNKPAVFSQAILEAHGAARFFTAVAGPDSRHPPKPHPGMLKTLLHRMSVSAAETVCAGDMEVDFEFARAAGCRIILIPAGSRDHNFLKTLNADGIIEKLKDLPSAIGAMS